ncbi:MAG TPA: hypothetical protein PLS22_00895 [Aquabacterium sp.]|jgi:hypothetical protein|nr:hypothetical protein [Aquabacterium sp.]
MHMHRALIILATLISGGSSAQAGITSFRELSPPDALVQVVSEQAVINGLPTTIFKFSSAHSPAEIAEFYKNKFGDKTLNQKLGRYQTIATLLDQKFYTVQIRPRLSGGADGTVSVADVSSKAQTPKLPDGLHLPMGSSMLFSSKNSDMGRKAETYVYATRLSLQETRRVLSASLQGAGYLPDNKPMGEVPKNSAVLSYTANGKEVIATINKNSSGLSLVVMNFVSGPSDERR